MIRSADCQPFDRSNGGSKDPPHKARLDVPESKVILALLFCTFL
jgi:hypothetical protein